MKAYVIFISQKFFKWKLESLKLRMPRQNIVHLRKMATTIGNLLGANQEGNSLFLLASI